MAHDSLGIVGTTVGGKYTIEEVVGEGSFSLVYRALHLVWQLPVAIKCFKVLGEVSTELRDQLLRDFIREGALLSELSGRSATIVQARDAGLLDPAQGEVVPYIVLEWLEGCSLATLLEEERAAFGPTPWPLERAKCIIEPVATALGMVHRSGIAHRDIKPENIWIGARTGDRAFVKLLDFGVAKVVKGLQKNAFRKTSGNVTSFTPAYGAPEQFSRALGATGPWTDVYALALVFTELLAGRCPTVGDDFVQLGMEALDAARRPTPRALGIPISDALERVFAKALSIKPYDRFASANEFWEAVQRAERSAGVQPMRSETASLAPQTIAQLTRRPSRRGPRPTGKTALASLALGAALGAGVGQGPPELLNGWRHTIGEHAAALGAAALRVVQVQPNSPVESTPVRPDDVPFASGGQCGGLAAESEHHGGSRP